MDLKLLSKFIKGNLYEEPDIPTSHGIKKSIYADYTASGKPFKYIENYIKDKVYPYYANTHSNAFCGRYMQSFIDKSKRYIRKVINANKDYSILFTGNGCSCAINHFIHILDLHNSEITKENTVVLITEMEHNSNFLPWKELNVTLKLIKLDNNTAVIDFDDFTNKMEKYKDYKNKIISVIACSNIIGVRQPIHYISKMGHKYGFIVCFDYACNAPYDPINMIGNDIDAIYLSPHKFLGGVGTTGLLVIKDKLFKNKCPLFPSGGTVRYTSNTKKIYSIDNEKRESGGTPNIIGCIKTGLVFKLKSILYPYIVYKEHKILKYVFPRLKNIPNMILLNKLNFNMLPIFSFRIPNLHYNLVVLLLNDLFGIQSRGGVSCSGLFAKKLLNINNNEENKIVNEITHDKGVPGDYGWCRVTFHYTMSFENINNILNGISFIAINGYKYEDLYKYDKINNIWEKQTFSANF
jgi:selenocysteine lyase/cysteine desulfurase